MYCFVRGVPSVTQDKLLFSPYTPLTDWPLLWNQILKRLHELLHMEYIIALAARTTEQYRNLTI
jgi:hypothetical protein